MVFIWLKGSSMSQKWALDWIFTYRRLFLVPPLLVYLDSCLTSSALSRIVAAMPSK